MTTIRKAGRTVRAFLKRKHGPIPTWGWIAIGSIGVIAFRRYGLSLPFGKKTTDTQQQQNQAYTSPQTPPDLYYTPGGNIPVDNSGAFPSSGGDTSGLLDLLKAILKAQGGGGGGGKGGKGDKGGDGKGGDGKGGKGGGKRHPKPKHGHHAGGHRHSVGITGGGKGHKRHRSGAHVRPANGGRHQGNHGASHTNAHKPRPHQPAMSAVQHGTGGSRHTRPVQGNVPRPTQHPQSGSHQARQQPGKSPPRPSAPPKRAMRAQKKR